MSASLRGLHITCFYSLMVKINSSLIHGVIVGSCPEMAPQSGQPVSRTWRLYAHSKYDFIQAKWEYACRMSQLVHLDRICALCGLTEVYVWIVCGFCVCVLVYQGVICIYSMCLLYLCLSVYTCD